jgi:hypothetical protein
MIDFMISIKWENKKKWQRLDLNLMENERIKEIKEEIADLKARWPAHSVPPSMWQKLEELEEKLEQAKKELEN